MVSLRKYCTLFCVLVYGASLVDNYRILGVFPFNGKSHNVMFAALMKGLAKRGHQVDDITHFPVKNAGKNYNVVVNLNGTLKTLVNSFTIDYVKSLTNDNLARSVADAYGNRFCKLMGLDTMQKFIKNPPEDPPYDVVITEAFGAHCFMGFGHLLNVPVIAVSTSAEYPWISEFIGNDDNQAYVPNVLLTGFDASRFLDRLMNMLSYYQDVYTFYETTEKVQTNAMRKYLKPDTPNIREVEKSVALTLINRHPILFGVKPIAPSLIEVSGLHIGDDDSELSLDLKKWLDDGVNGVVYFTFGSLILVESLSQKTILDLYKSFTKLAPMKVLMKIADKRKLPDGLPKNVYTLPWIPQQAVLNHSNVRVFITHGGLMGCQEALYFAVPVIGIPIFCDQNRNIALFVKKNMGVEIKLDNLTTTSLDEALNEVLENPKYKQNMMFYSKLFKDRPMNGMDTAIFWIEYIVRNGPDVLRSPALDLKWWQLKLLDVYGLILLCVVSSMTLVYYVIKLLLKKIICRSSKKTKRE